MLTISVQDQCGFLGWVVQVRGLVSYSVKLESGITVRQHVDHLQERTASAEVPGVDDLFLFLPVADTDSGSTDTTAHDPLPSTENSTTEPTPSSHPLVRRSRRQCQSPDLWGF